MTAFSTCVDCIVLKDASPEAEPHAELRKAGPDGMGTSYDCNSCGTKWTHHPKTGWKPEAQRNGR